MIAMSSGAIAKQSFQASRHGASRLMDEAVERLYSARGSSHADVHKRLLHEAAGSFVLRPGEGAAQRVLSYRTDGGGAAGAGAGAGEPAVRHVMVARGSSGWRAGTSGAFSSLLELLYSLSGIIDGGLRLHAATALAAQELEQVGLGVDRVEHGGVGGGSLAATGAGGVGAAAGESTVARECDADPLLATAVGGGRAVGADGHDSDNGNGNDNSSGDENGDNDSAGAELARINDALRARVEHLRAEAAAKQAAIAQARRHLRVLQARYQQQRRVGRLEHLDLGGGGKKDDSDNKGDDADGDQADQARLGPDEPLT